MVKFVVDFSKDLEQGLTDGRLDAPAVHRNHEFILDVLIEHLDGVSGHAIEIGSGTGQHVVGFAKTFPDLTWWPSDPNPTHITSIDAWNKHIGADNVMPAVQIDAASDWALGEGGRPPLSDIAAVFSANVVHIASWDVGLGILKGAAECLQNGGLMIFYGPYARDGDLLSQGNVDFDQALRGRNPEWGVRDVSQMREAADKCGLLLNRIVDMPSNNSMLVFERS